MNMSVKNKKIIAEQYTSSEINFKRTKPVTSKDKEISYSLEKLFHKIYVTGAFLK